MNPLPAARAESSGNWLLLDSGACDYASNMACDELLLDWAPRLGHPVLRFYGWEQPAASFGYFQKYRDVETLTPLRPLVRRPTGGGIVPHDRDWTYCLAIPRGHAWYTLSAVESYRRVHEWLREAFLLLGIETQLAPSQLLSGPGQCFAGHEQHDLLWMTRKVAGAAQRRTRAGLLVQGSVQSPAPSLAREDWQQAMLRALATRELAEFTPFQVPPELANAVLHLAKCKYSTDGYNRKR